MTTDVKIAPSWREKLSPEFGKPYFQQLIGFVREEYKAHAVYPPGKEIFRAFDWCDFNDAKIIIIGQDPYHGPGQANGLCFSVDFKLRTVVWEFGGEQIDDALIDSIRPLIRSVPLDIATLLDDDEVAALQERARWVANNPVFPVDQSGRRYPWPIV